MFDNHSNSVAHHLQMATEVLLVLSVRIPSFSTAKPRQQNHLFSLWGDRMRRRLPAASGWPPPQNALRKQNARGHSKSRLTVAGNPKFSVALPSCKLLLQKKNPSIRTAYPDEFQSCSARISSLGTDGDVQY
ncbi:hypothetical protein V8C26DRAFT_391068 [Trichoderma gracile]